MFENFYSEQVKSQLTACLRVLPHHQNTSGFFITIIEKVAELDGHQPELALEDAKIDRYPGVI
jgi:multisite-specific tRNA:(cytosine-C5)-methyltransferase